MIKRLPLAFMAIFSFSLSVGIHPATLVAQNVQPIIKIGDFTGDALPANELSTLRRLVSSYVSEFKTFKVIDTSATALALDESETALKLGSGSQSGGIALVSPDFVLSASLSRLQDEIVFTLENVKVRTGEKRMVSDRYRALGDIALSARALTCKLFDRPVDRASQTASATDASGGPAATNPVSDHSKVPEVETRSAAESVGAAVPLSSSILSLASIAGIWKGDKGVEKVRVLKDGRALATLASGITMKLRISFENGRVVASQDQQNSPLFYASSSYGAEIARQIAAKARPVRWVFSMSQDQKTLEGIKESVAVQGLPDGSLSVDNSYTRPAIWTRLQ